MLSQLTSPLCEALEIVVNFEPARGLLELVELGLALLGHEKGKPIEIENGFSITSG